MNLVIHGDCIVEMGKLADNSVDLILTDIPYGEVNRKSNGLRNLNKEKADILTFDLDKFMEECERVCKGSIYIFCGIGQVSHIHQKMTSMGLSVRHCIWHKTNPSPMNGQHMWLSGLENCIYAKKKNATFNEHCKGSVWTFPNGKGKVHPTEKSLKLFEYLMSASSNPGDIVLDPCAGSGTTAVAAKKLNRDYIMIESEEEYVSIINNRVI